MCVISEQVRIAKDEADMKYLLREFYMAKVRQWIKIGFASLALFLWIGCLVFIITDPFNLNIETYKYSGTVSQSRWEEYQPIIEQNKEHVYRVNVSFYPQSEDVVYMSVNADRDIGIGVYTYDKCKNALWFTIELLWFATSLLTLILLIVNVKWDVLKG